MIEAIGNYEKYLKIPSYHECKVPLLKKEFEYKNNLIKYLVVERENFGFTIMSNGWTIRRI